MGESDRDIQPGALCFPHTTAGPPGLESPGLPSLPHSRLKILIPAALFVILLWTLIGVWAWTERQETLRTYSQILSSMTAAVAEQVNGLMTLTELSLGTATHLMNDSIAVGKAGTPPDLLTLTEKLRQRSDGLIDVLVLRADGTVTTIPPTADAPITPEESAETLQSALLAAPSPGMVLSPPLINRPQGPSLLPILKNPGRDRHGHMPFAVVHMAALEAVLNAQRLQPRGSIALLRDDGLVLIRSPDHQVYTDLNLSQLDSFRTLWRTQRSGTYIGTTSKIDGLRRIVSFVRLRDYPLYVAMAVPVDDVLAPWFNRVIALTVACAVASALAVGITTYLLLMMRRIAISSRRFEDIAETASDLIWETDAHGHLSFVSDRCLRIFGTASATVLGRPWHHAGLRPASLETAQTLRRALGTHSPFSDLRLHHAVSGLQRRIFSLAGRPFFDHTGAFAGYRGTASDITERIRQEEERLRRIEQETQRGKLEALGQLAGGIAHDFNNLIGAISGFAQFLVQDSPAGTPQRRYAERIVTACQRGRSLVQQIITFSRRVPRPPTNVSVAEVIHETCDLLRAILPSTTHLTVANDGGDVQIAIDRDQLGQVLVNLCVNASDALDLAPGLVEINATPLPADTALWKTMPLAGLPMVSAPPTPVEVHTWSDGRFDWITTGGLTTRHLLSLTVRDTGSGIPPSHHRALFDLFFTTKDQRGGSGLGLPVVQRIVTGHGGAIVVKTQTGSGTMFQILLPISGFGRQAAPPPPAINGPSPHPRAAIMVIDDDPDFCAMLTAALERLGHDVVSVNDPLEGLAALEESPALWDLIVTDQTMPGLNGVDLVRRAKSIKPDIRCILCTGYSQKVNEQEALTAGADAFFPKPIILEEFGALIARLLTQPPAPAPEER